jgi:gliding motility-associated-like protein
MALATASCKSDTTAQTITIYANPVAAFDFNTGCLVDSLVYFTNNTTVSDAQTLNFAWNFGDANTSTQTSPSHQYAGYGTYPVTLTASTANGCVSTLTKSYRVAGFKPNVAFTVANETALCAANPINITQQTALAQDSVYRVDIFWDALNQPTVFETDNAPTVAEIYQHAYAAFTAPATKNVTIKWLVYSKGGCITEYNKVITLHASPVLSYPTLTGICVNAAPKSVATATASNGVTGTGVYSGLGTDATGNFSPATAGVGVHTIKYVFTTSGGCKDSITQTIRVFAKPSASFTLSGSVCLQDSVQFNNTSTIAAGNIASWNWIFGDGNTANYSNGNAFYHTYNNFGNFIAQLTVVSDSSCVSDTAFRPVVIHPLPVVDFTIPAFVCMPAGNAAFTNTSTINGGTISNLSFAWDFGDGNTSVQISPTHTYAAVGNYAVRLVATSQQGCVADTVKQLSSFFPQPDAKFGISAPELCEGVASVFSDSSTAPLSAVASYAWDFGNGTTSTQPNPTVTYATPGNYTVRLTVTNTQGCTSDIETATVKVNLQPVVDAGLEKTVSQFSSIQLSPTVNSTTLNFAWTPAATLNNPNSLNPTATPLDNTWYKLTATGDGGCFATDSVLIKVLIAITIPNAFSPNNDGINDVWNVKGLSNYGNARIEIFARNGQLVYKSTGYNTPWDGKRNGQPLPAGVYYYIIEPNDRGYGKLTGFVTIVR